MERLRLALEVSVRAKDNPHTVATLPCEAISEAAEIPELKRRSGGKDKPPPEEE